MNAWAFRRLWIFLQVIWAISVSAATHTLTLSTNGSGSVGANPAGGIYPHNSTVTLTATPSSGWQFIGWSGDVSSALNPLNVLMDSDKLITANFSQVSSYTLTLNVSGVGSVDPPGGTYLSNTVVSLTAISSNGWVFHHWSGDASGGSNPLNVTMSSNKTIAATFIEPATITAQPQGATVSPGVTASFTVAASGTGSLSYQWRFNDLPIIEASNSTLTLSNVQLANAGSYQVIVSNSYGSITSAVAVLTVTCPGTNVVSVAGDAALRAALNIGGNVRLCFSGTVTLTDTIDITKDVVLDASGVSVVIDGNNAVRLFNVSVGVSFIVTNVVFADGLRRGADGIDAVGANAALNGEPATAGAIYNAGGFVRLVSCTITNNQAQGGNGGSGNSTATANGAGADAEGGAIYNAGGTVILQNVALLNNRARGGHGGTYSGSFPPSYGGGGSVRGGAIYNAEGLVTVAGGVLISNVASAAPGAFAARPLASGGATYQDGGSMIFSNVSFFRNASSGGTAEGFATTPLSSPANAEAGAVSIGGGFGVFGHVRFIENSANGGHSFRGSGSSFAEGGALVNRSTIEISFCTISSNSAVAGSGGADSLSALGGAFFNFGTGIVSASSFDNNWALGGSGGAWGTIFGWPGAPGIGGAVFNGGILLGTNSTIALNQARGGNAASGGRQAGNAYGGGIYNTGQAEIINVTIASNSALAGFGLDAFTAGANIVNTNGTFSLRNSLVAYPRASSNAWGTIIDNGYNISSDGSANFSGGTSFNFTDPKLLPLANNDGPTLTMALAPDSPAIDWAPVITAPATDQRGFARPYGALVDLGAFELWPAVPPLGARHSGTNVSLSFAAQAGVTYRIDRSSDFFVWSIQEHIGVLSTNGIVSRSYPGKLSRQFYRLALDF